MPVSLSHAAEKKPLVRTLDTNGFRTENGERFWSRPLYGPNKRMFVPAGELPHAAFMWFAPANSVFVRCGHFLPGVVSSRGTKWLYQAEEITAVYDPGMLKFTIRDPILDGEVRLELVPLASGDGYAVQVISAADISFAFAFGGFLCMPDKDSYQGTGNPPGGIVTELYRDTDYSAHEDTVSVAKLKNLFDKEGKSLNMPLQVVLLTERKTEITQHDAKTGVTLEKLLQQPVGTTPVQVHRVALKANEPFHIVVAVPTPDRFEVELKELRGNTVSTFERCLKRVNEISHRISLETPDTLVDLGARSLSVSMDALWCPPVFLHGPIRWGWPGLVGWRMAYGGDVCGTYDRVASHCKNYGDNQYKEGFDRRPRAEPKTALTRQASDSLLFSEGAVVNWGSYNMTGMWLNFVAHHYDWTGDREFLRVMGPAIRDGLAFEKRAMDMDGDSLYENYANTYITDAHWHNGGNCAQESAYVHAGCVLAAEAARLAGESPEPYLAEAVRIRTAMNNVLWLREKGIFAEWKDTLGQKLLHPEPELGSIYLSVHCGVADDFQAYQMLRYTEWGLPNQIIEEKGPQLFDGFYSKGSTYEFPQPMRAREVKSSNWRPIILTVHECSPGEQMDLARVYFKLGLADRAFPLLKAVLRCMVNLPTSGGLVIRDRNTEKWSRSWSYNDVDHCDTIGPSLQCIAEGLFGIHPRLSEDMIEIQPGFPSDWDHAKIKLRDISYSFSCKGDTDTFLIATSKPTTKKLRLVMHSDGDTVTVNGQAAVDTRIVAGICHPFLEVMAPKGTVAEFAVTHSSSSLPKIRYSRIAARDLSFSATCDGGKFVELKDPQGIFAGIRMKKDRFTAKIVGNFGHHTAFVRVKGKAVEFWEPLEIEVREPLEIAGAVLSADTKSLTYAICNNGPETRDIQAVVSCGGKQMPVRVRLDTGTKSADFIMSLETSDRLTPGLNQVTLTVGKSVFETTVECWDLFKRNTERKAGLVFNPVDISQNFNDNLALVHTHEYISPRSKYCSLQPGIDIFREWCSCQSKPCGELDLGVLRNAVGGNNGILMTEPGIPFKTSAEGKNIVFVSQWDNFPKSLTIPIGRSACVVYLLMASVTNPMQSGVVNGRVILNLKGGGKELLELINPRNLSWCVTNYPNRYGPLYLIQPAVKLGQNVYGTIYSVPLRTQEYIESITVEAVSIESVIGLMGVTMLVTE